MSLSSTQNISRDCLHRISKNKIGACVIYVDKWLDEVLGRENAFSFNWFLYLSPWESFNSSLNLIYLKQYKVDHALNQHPALKYLYKGQ